MMKINTIQSSYREVEFKLNNKRYIHSPDYHYEDGYRTNPDTVYITKREHLEVGEPVVGYIEVRQPGKYTDNVASGLLPALFVQEENGMFKLMEGTVRSWLKRGTKMFEEDRKLGTNWIEIQDITLFN